MLKMRTASTLLAATSLLAVAAVGPADAKKSSCKAKKEQVGCRLASGTEYNGTTSAGGGNVGVRVEKSGWSLGIVVNDRTGPCSGRLDRTSVDFDGRPKVGQTYRLQQRRSLGRGLRGTIAVSGKVKITSAKRATVSGSYHRERPLSTGGTAVCDRSLNVAAKRDR